MPQRGFVVRRNFCVYSECVKGVCCVPLGLLVSDIPSDGVTLVMYTLDLSVSQIVPRPDANVNVCVRARVRDATGERDAINVTHVTLCLRARRQAENIAL